jgi:tripartite-type tricarboxylate transporter receptor subunit TctC
MNIEAHGRWCLAAWSAVSRCRLLVFAFAMFLPSFEIDAQSFPSRPMRIVIPNPPGGTLDIVARIVTPKMAELGGQSVIIDNRPGADTNIGTELVARAPANGYTMMLHTVPFVVNPALFAKLPFDVVKDFAPVSLMVSVPFVLVVNNSVPAKSVKDLIALAKSQPDKLSYASAGNGSNLHVAAELFNNLTGTKMLHVQYKGGGPALVAVLGGETSLSYLSIAAAAPHIKAGRLRALGATGTQAFCRTCRRSPKAAFPAMSSRHGSARSYRRQRRPTR